MKDYDARGRLMAAGASSDDADVVLKQLPRTGQALKTRTETAIALMSGASGRGVSEICYLIGFGSIDLPDAGRLLADGFSPAFAIAATTGNFAVDAIKAHRAGITVEDLQACEFDWAYITPADLAAFSSKHGMPSALAPQLVNGQDANVESLEAMLDAGLSWDDIAWLDEHSAPLATAAHVLDPDEWTPGEASGLQRLEAAGVPFPALPADVRRLAALIAMNEYNGASWVPDAVAVAATIARTPWVDIFTTVYREHRLQGGRDSIVDLIVRARAVEQDPAWLAAIAQTPSMQDGHPEPSREMVATLRGHHIPKAVIPAIADVLADGSGRAFATEAHWLASDLYAGPDAPPLAAALLALRLSMACEFTSRDQQPGHDVCQQWAMAAVGTPWSEQLVADLRAEIGEQTVFDSSSRLAALTLERAGIDLAPRVELTTTRGRTVVITPGTGGSRDRDRGR